MAETAGYKISLDINQDDGFWDQVRLRAENESLENTLMEPDDWRIPVHRILRTDIYGHGMMPFGLKGIIAEMERRQQKMYEGRIGCCSSEVYLLDYVHPVRA
jgi:hypothetical protein